MLTIDVRLHSVFAYFMLHFTNWECTILCAQLFFMVFVTILLVYSFLKVLQCPSAKMEMFVWLDIITYQVEWKFAIIKYGELFVMMIGMSGMLEWCADNLEYPQSVSITTT